MVQLVEIIARASERSQEALELAQDLKKVVEKHRGKSPDVLGGVTIYDRNDGRSYYHDLYIHDRNSSLFINKKTRGSTALTDRPNLLLHIFEEKPNEPLSKDYLINNGGGVSVSSLRRNICDLREIVEVDPQNPQIIVLVRGIGYMLKDKSKRFDVSVGGNYFK